MRGKLIFTVSVILGTAIGFVVVREIRALQEMAWITGAEANVERFSRAVGIYKSDNDRYPDSLSELLLHSRSELTNYLHEVEGFDRFHNKYEYQRLTNGFLIKATRPGTWFLKSTQLEKRYKFGEPSN